MRVFWPPGSPLSVPKWRCRPISLPKISTRLRHYSRFSEDSKWETRFDPAARSAISRNRVAGSISTRSARGYSEPVLRVRLTGLRRGDFGFLGAEALDFDLSSTSKNRLSRAVFLQTSGL
jgi:hypothetical protein